MFTAFTTPAIDRDIALGDVTGREDLFPSSTGALISSISW